MSPPPDWSRPWISVNLAISADGKTSDVHGHPSGWTSRADHDRLLELRKPADAILVGRRTLMADRMTMTRPGDGPQPLRCVVAKEANLPTEHPVFSTPGGEIHWLATAATQPAEHAAPTGAEVHHGSLAGFLTTLFVNLSVKHLHCEGGGTIVRMLAEIDAIDELHLTLAGHTLFGGADAATATGTPGPWLPESLKLRLTTFTTAPGSGECFLSYRRADG